MASDPLIPLISSVPSEDSAAGAAAYLERQHRRLTERTGYSFAVAALSSDDAVGSIGLWTHDIESGRATTGYWIAAGFRRRGYASAALQALTAWAVTIPEVARIELYVEPWNTASWRAAELAGYVRGELLPSWQLVGDARKDMWRYTLLPSR